MGERSSNLWSCSEYNGNNAWIFNSTNGTMNNNNKMNGNGVRGSLEFDFNESMLKQFLSLYAEYLDDYRTTRKHKRSKNSQLVFEFHLQDYLIPLVRDVFARQYIPKPSNLFNITEPTLREVIAAWFGDRIPQTRIVKTVMPLLERNFFHNDSYSCRVGKGGLRAVQNLIDYIRQETHRYTRQAWIYKFDIKSFFMSIDMKIFFPVFVEFVKKYLPEGDRRDEILYLARIVYLGYPQEHCILKSPAELLNRVKEDKSLRHRFDSVGLPIGNITSQMLCLMVTTFILRMLEEYGLKFVHYTDDNCGITRDTRSFMKFMTWLKNEVWQRWHLKIHPDKFYLQYYKKTVNLLGFKIKYGSLLLPGNRLVHNFKWKVKCAIRKAEKYPDYIYLTKESFAGVLCSYLGLLKHTASYTLRKGQMTLVAASRWSKVLDIDTENYYKVSVKPHCTRMAFAVRQNRQRKKQLKSYYNELIRNSSID